MKRYDAIKKNDGCILTCFLRVLATMTARGGTFGLSKCSFFMNQLIVLGVLVSPGCLSIDQERKAGVLKYPVPTKVKQIRQFLGLMNNIRPCSFRTCNEKIAR